MTATAFVRAVTAPITDRPSIAGMIVRRFHAARQRRHERRAMRELRGLNCHTLKDIGLHRSEITSVVCVDQSDRRHRHANH